MSEWVEKNGKKYRVDREFYIAEDESHLFYRGAKFNLIKDYYKRSGGFSKEKPCNLHRAVWMDNFGPIPEKHHIHHVDGNRRNNHIENLQCLPAFVHLSRAAKTNKWLKSKENKEHLIAIRDKTNAWHSSKEGRKWHSQCMKNSWQIRKTTLKKCEECGQEFETYFPSRAKYCHRNCSARATRKAGIENENRRCQICQKYFVINRYCHTKTCSRVCADILSKKTRALKACSA